MRSKSSNLQLPQTAADLLEGLLRSQLFAESIFRQIREQSRRFLKHRADEFAAALVQKKVLTAWHAMELLEGRSSFYAGTFRLLERLTTDKQRSIFVAEQPAAQRLVLLDVTPRRDVVPETCESRPKQFRYNHPHIARCVLNQSTPKLRLVAYEFIEAAWLRDVIASQAPSRSQRAHLLCQFARALSVLDAESIDAIDLSATLLDSHGQLQWLAGAPAFANDTEVNKPRTTDQAARQMQTLQRFANSLGGFPEIANCRELTEVVSCLGEFGEPWSDAFPKERILRPRALMNRLLRKGPSQKLIEAFHGEQQFSLESPLKTAPRPNVSHTPQTISPAPRRTPSRKAKPVAVTSPPIPTPVPSLRSKPVKLPQRIQPTRQSVWARTSLATALIGAIVSGVIGMQWTGLWTVPQAKAQSESEISNSSMPTHAP